MNTNPNDPAMPVHLNIQLQGETFPGVTKREFFAAMAMQGLRAGTPIWHEQHRDGATHTASECWATKQIAEQSVRDADALIAALNNEKH